MEVTLTVLRDHKEILLSVLEPFLRDPTVCWKRSGRAQRSDLSTGRPSSAQGLEQEKENSDAKAALSTINERLCGIYNISHPNADQICRGHAARSQSPSHNGSSRGQPSRSTRLHRGIGAVRREELPLSVQGQVQRLIDEAVAVENLAQMFIGKWLLGGS
jgi:phosphatidylinositol kinase/protein kinase (PI-3  family)